MGDVITQSTIWKSAGGVSAITGLVCFALGSSYDMSFGKLGYGGFLVYLLVCLIIWRLIVGDERIQVSEGVQGVVVALIFVVICVLSVVLEKYLPQKSDAFTITSYGSFALMSVSLSRKLELGFETGFSVFFLQLLASQLFKIKWFLFPIALVFCFVIIILRHYPESVLQFLRRYSESVVQFLRHYSESGVQFLRHSPVQEVGSIPSNNGSHPPPNWVATDIESQYSRISSTNSQDTEESSESQYSRISSTNSQDTEESSESQYSRISSTNSQDIEESSETRLYSPSNYGQVSEESISDWGNEQNNEQEEDSTSSLAAEFSYSSEQDHVPPANYPNGYVHRSPPRQLLRRRRREDDTCHSTHLKQPWRHASPLAPTTPLFFFFFSLF